MLGKIGVALLSIQLAFFAIAGLANIVGHGGFAGSSASAQSLIDGSAASDADDSSPTPDAKKKPPADIAGFWSGPIDDSIFGEGTFNVTIDETAKGKLSGSWNDTFGGSGNFKGTVNSKGETRFNLRGGGACRASGVGLLVSADELTGTYRLEHCGKQEKGEHGTLDLFNN
jgi:hypothetical protein